LQIENSLRDRLAFGSWQRNSNIVDQPLRAELFSVVQMERHGKLLAKIHELDSTFRPDRLLNRLADNETVLKRVCNSLADTVKQSQSIAPAGEWLLDNFYLIEEQIRTAKRDFSKGYSRELPRLSNGPSSGLPRVYGIALEAIAHGDGRVDLEGLSRFIAAYQSVAPLTLGELWAIPIMLRLACIENLRRVISDLSNQRTYRALANAWADRMIDTAEKDPNSLILVVANMARSNPPIVSSFVAELTRRLQGHGPALALPLTWVEQRLSDSGLTTDQLVDSETKLQSADQASVSNSIGTLRFLGSTDWRKFVEANSVVESILGTDPAGYYNKMEFFTRDQYRHVVERIAKNSRFSEGDVAGKAIELASRAKQRSDSERAIHVGYYLLDKGLPQLECMVEMRGQSIKLVQRWFLNHALIFYLTGIALITITLTALLLRQLGAASISPWQWCLIVPVFVLCTGQLTIAFVNWLVMLLSTPRSLPRLDFCEAIPVEFKTLVVVPTMLTSADGIESLIESLEVRFLANKIANLHFALLTDFRDAGSEKMPGDDALLLLAQERVEGLNRKYKGASNGNFYLFHRPRRWNQPESIFMGYERKRGKLSELNAFLRGARTGQFSRIVGDITALTDVKFVITLDTDTQLPRDVGRQLVGAMAHPLNRPVWDAKRRLVTDGYGILQPRVDASLPSANRSIYARLHGGEPGIDPYTRTISDVYQDLFGQGSFIGKGIYDVDAFELSVKNRFPDNRILSHDLLEGCYARSGLLTDVQLYEAYPSLYSADVARRFRWIRGDWQISEWLLENVPGPNGTFERNQLSLLSRWKIADNLRRSLTPVAFCLFLLLAWTQFSHIRFWTSAALTMILLPLLMASGEQIFRKQEDVLLHEHLLAVMVSARRHLEQAIFTLICLLHEACFSLEAIGLTTYRMLCTRRHLLDWSTSADSRPTNTLPSTFSRMWVSLTLAGGTAVYLIIQRPSVLPLAAPVLTFWLLAPIAVWWVSRPLAHAEVRFTDSETIFLRKLARRSWAFFQQFAGADHNWLPADNYQEQPVERTAQRTSPTNIGMALLANLTAHDFGYITSGELIDRTAGTFTTMDLLERHRGHFCNWYDTQSLKPLIPMYISTVDSGNLAGHLQVLRLGLLDLPGKKVLSTGILDGLKDVSAILTESLEVSPRGVAQPEHAQVGSLLVQFIESLRLGRQASPKLHEFAALLKKLRSIAGDITRSIDANAFSEANFWSQRLLEQCSSALTELDFLTPWISLPSELIKHDLIAELENMPSLSQLAIMADATDSRVRQYLASPLSEQERQFASELQGLIATASDRASQRIGILNQLALRANEFAQQMEYSFLFDESRHLLAIGYNLTEGRLDSGYYDLLASEARFCNFIGIAQGQLPQESWFALGRLLTTIGGDAVLFSWSGSMFEYLMPLLVMPTFEHTLLDQTYKASVQRQIEYGNQRGVPWGISESGYSVVDAQLNYQYRSFGVPGLGLRRGLADDLVIAPYATALALMVAPEPALHNLQRLSADRFTGRFGLYEAIDYTPAHLPPGQSRVVVQSYMAHHQAMTFLSMAYVLLEQPMQKRFESDPSFQATMLLLQERIPTTGVVHWQSSDISARTERAIGKEAPLRIFDDPDTANPEVTLLSNGRYHVMVTNAGGGYSRWSDLFLTRWREDATLDNWGAFCYVRDTVSGEFWSTTHQPTLKRSETYSAMFSEAKAEFRRRDFDIETYTEIVVSSEDDIELRRVRLTNRSGTTRTMSLTSYGEVVLASADADAQQPAFSNLFVQTEFVEENKAIVCTRRPRSPDEKPPWLFHLVAEHKGSLGQISYETDRMKFIGRGRTVANPLAMTQGGPLSGSHGSVLDPIVSIRCHVSLEPGESATVNLVSGIAETRARALELIEKYRDRVMAERVFDLAWTHAQVILRQLNATEVDAQMYGRLANSIVYSNSLLRADGSVLVKNRRGQSGLWGYAISGDLPIVLLQIKHPENIGLVRQLVQAHAYWRLKGLKVDLMIINEDTAGYRQVLQDQIMSLIAGLSDSNLVDKPGGIFLRPVDQISAEDRILLLSVARAVISDSRGSLEQQISRRAIAPLRVPRLKPVQSYRSEVPAEPPPRHLILYNGLGGFTPDGREYVITTQATLPTPAPWVNILANRYFGSVISESGVSYTWAENAHEFRLTPWNNDPVSDTSGELFYIRDQQTGHFWSPSSLPAGGASPYVSRHGFGYSVFEHTESQIVSELTVHVALDAPIKFSVLKLRNASGRPRKLSVTGYVEWVLGDLRSKTAMQIVTQIDPKTGAVFAQNLYNLEFQDRVNFFDVDDLTRTITCDRTEFFGRNGSARNPLAMSNTRLSNKVGAALDPCAAIQIEFDLADGEEREFIFRLGSGRDTNDASALINRFRGVQARRDSFEKTCQYWKHTLGAVNVQTPDDSLNMLTNGWLLYQDIACRMWGRSGFYQSGGAFGFRDQIQDAMALVHAEPSLLREQLLLCASRQFLEGDAQHWWHPPSGRGIRSHCSDDLLWLPLATCRYVAKIGDTGVLDEEISFLEGPPVNFGEESYYAQPSRSPQSASLYEHCKRAILRGLRFGERGLPLIGSGDWNDGMNLVGINGKGESVWLGFFLCAVLQDFQKLANLRGDEEFSQTCAREAANLSANIEKNAWDGKWYRRAYFDDGTPLGSSSNEECKIDSIAQSWSVLSGAGDKAHSHQAMDSLDTHLVHRDTAIVQLLEPPFDKSALNPGYIKGYVPGVRENGGQYTHAAIWAAMAFAAMGNNESAWELLAMINPVNHGRTLEDVAIYKVEPYVVAGDVYACPPHTGRGGWTWYTGSAGWLYRLIVESLLGVKLEVNKLRFNPCLPKDWQEFKVHYRFYETVYHITVNRSDEPPSVIVDGACMLDAAITMNDDRREHFVEVKIPNGNNVS
jgi:cellobiose phosphorylase